MAAPRSSDDQRGAFEALEEIDVDEQTHGESPIPERHQDKFRITARNGYLVGGEEKRDDVMCREGRKIWEGSSQATVIVDERNNTGRVMGTSEEAARQLARVKEIENSLEVRAVREARGEEEIDAVVLYDEPEPYDVEPEARRTGEARTGHPDRELKRAVESKLAWSPFVDVENIQVSVKNGVATLSGTVEDREEMGDVIENAYEAGARKVVNELEARGEEREERNERRGKRRVRRCLRRRLRRLQRRLR